MKRNIFKILGTKKIREYEKLAKSRIKCYNYRNDHSDKYFASTKPRRFNDSIFNISITRRYFKYVNRTKEGIRTKAKIYTERKDFK